METLRGGSGVRGDVEEEQSHSPGCGCDVRGPQQTRALVAAQTGLGLGSDCLDSQSSARPTSSVGDNGQPLRQDPGSTQTITPEQITEAHDRGFANHSLPLSNSQHLAPEGGSPLRASSPHLGSSPPSTVNAKTEKTGQVMNSFENVEKLKIPPQKNVY
ncbi:hypothetical protein JEQ12_006484 [Ovis aries]|uniref:Uncharacterized protein n=1 Tax=Ovis aries TaxID=9940 RepID=A0A836CV30_SHEEP|nr:hypothetical protein JEQ12_006484 [Ovis aries]